MTETPPKRDSVATAHAVVYFVCGAVLGGGADLVVSHLADPATGQIAGFAGFAAGIALAWAVTRRWYPDDAPPPGPEA